MKFATLGYTDTQNIGDSIQSVAVLQHIEQDYIIVDRDNLKEYDGDPCVVVMNGWFSHKPQNWPPSKKIHPIFFGFHMTPQASKFYVNHIDYFKKHEPIGCRDAGTADTLQKWGVDAYVSGCATMTFPERAVAPQHGKNIVVDIDRRLFCREDRKNIINVSQESYVDYVDDHTRNNIALQLLNYYKNNAALIVTSRIHCAMPCFAMGIPVIYCGERSYRTHVINLIDLPSVEVPQFWVKSKAYPKNKRLKFDAMPFSKPNYDDTKKSIAAKLRGLLSEHGIRLKDWSSKDN